MKKKNIIALCVAGVVLLIVSICIGIGSARSVQNKTTATPLPSPYKEDELQETISGTTVPEEAARYKISLSGTTLHLYDGDALLNETEIAPDVLPRADVKALTKGIEYFTIEEALVDWESLCK